ncbi:MAG: hypothetical protein M4579_001406 [Chaenotheca gracillima]|nr:MAG: hypothetical protein M4579_001406 [Chaenotheca gracillima]
MSLNFLIKRNSKYLFNGCGVAAFLHLFTDYIASIKPTYGPSMLPTINVRDESVFINKYYRRGRNIKIGDIVSVRHPLEHDERAIKRVMGMPGDFVLRDTPGRGEGLMIQVPQGHCWLIGDNLESSRDSRTYGPVPLALVQGKVVASMAWRSFPKAFADVFSAPR